MPVPLVIHGGTSFPPDAVPRAIAAGVAKFNVGTILKQRVLRGTTRSRRRRSRERRTSTLIIGSHKRAGRDDSPAKRRMRAKCGS